LSNSQKGEFELKVDHEIDQFKAYLASNTQKNQAILEDELAALNAILSEVTHNSQEKPESSSGDLLELKQLDGIGMLKLVAPTNACVEYDYFITFSRIFDSCLVKNIYRSRSLEDIGILSYCNYKEV